MKNNDDLQFETTKNNDDAQAMDKSELLPIFEGMKFSGDIQPLEYVSVPDYEKTEISDDKSDSYKSDLKKKKRSFSAISNKKFKKFIIAAVSLILTVALATTAIVLIIGSGKNESPVLSVYAGEKDNTILLADGSEYKLSEVQEVKVSDDGMMLYYSTQTASKTGKFDLKVVDVSKKKSLNKEGSYIDNGIDEGWYINSDGSFMCFSKTVDGVKNYYLYSAEDGTTELVASNVEEVFLPAKGDVIYFTRRISSIYSLHRKRYGEESQNVVSEVNHVFFYDSEENGFEVLYTLAADEQNAVNVYSVKNYEEPKVICENVGEVYMNDYEVTGNLYYFTKDTATVDWKDFINDPYFDTDATLERPVEGDYMVNVGFIFDRYVLDYNAFTAAEKKYNAKLLRDDIREELDRIDLGLAVKDTYTCYMYNGTTKELASGIMLENVLGFSATGLPRLIYAKSVIEVDSKIEMDTLVGLAKNDNVTKAIDHVTEVLSNSHGLSDECIYTWYDSKMVLEYTLDEYEVEKTKFILGEKDSLYVLSDGNLYRNTITQKEIKKGELIDKNVAECEFKEGALYYTKENDSGKVSLYRHSTVKGKEHLADNIYTYFVSEEDYVIILTRKQADVELMDVAVFSGGKYTEIDTDVSLNNFVCNKKSFAYIKNTGAYDTYGAGDMYIYPAENGTSASAVNVTKIFYVKK